MFEPIITWVISSEPETLKDDPLEAQYCAKAKEGIKKDNIFNDRRNIYHEITKIYQIIIKYMKATA